MHYRVVTICFNSISRLREKLGMMLAWHPSQAVTRSNRAASLNGLFIAFIENYIGEGLFPFCFNLVHNFTWHISSAGSNKILRFQGNQEGPLSRGLRQGEHTVAAVTSTTAKGCWCSDTISAPKRHKEEKKTRGYHHWDSCPVRHLTAGPGASGEEARADFREFRPHSAPPSLPAWARKRYCYSKINTQGISLVWS